MDHITKPARGSSLQRPVKGLCQPGGIPLKSLTRRTVFGRSREPPAWSASAMSNLGWRVEIRAHAWRWA